MILSAQERLDLMYPPRNGHFAEDEDEPRVWCGRCPECIETGSHGGGGMAPICGKDGCGRAVTTSWWEHVRS